MRTFKVVECWFNTADGSSGQEDRQVQLSQAKALRLAEEFNLAQDNELGIIRAYRVREYSLN